MKNIKKVAKEYKEKNGNSRISNKDLLFYILSRLDDIEKTNAKQDTWISSVEARQKMFMVFLPVAVGVTAIIIGLV